MLNILIPLAGRSKFFDEERYHYPPPLIEIAGKLMIERVVENLSGIPGDKQFIFIVSEDDCRKHHLDDVLGLLVDNPHIVRLAQPTRGAACSALMAVEYLDNDDPLLISNGDQVLDTDLGALLGLDSLAAEEARVFCFPSVHPRWSYVSCDDDLRVQEVTEKRPISHRAIAGLYLYGRGRDFVANAMTMIRKGDAVESRYYIAPTLNQHILAAQPVQAVDLDPARYHTLYTPERLAEYEEYLQQH